jgi:hypothetical protein
MQQIIFYISILLSFLLVLAYGQNPDMAPGHSSPEPAPNRGPQPQWIVPESPDFQVKPSPQPQVKEPESPQPHVPTKAPENQNPQPHTPAREPETLNPVPQPQVKVPETQNPQPHTPAREPESPNPAPQPHVKVPESSNPAPQPHTPAKIPESSNPQWIVPESPDFQVKPSPQPQVKEPESTKPATPNPVPDTDDGSSEKSKGEVKKIRDYAVQIKEDIDSSLSSEEATTTIPTTILKLDQITVEITVTLGINSTQQTLNKICETWRSSLTKNCGREFNDCNWTKMSKRQAGAVYQGSTMSPAPGSNGANQLLLSLILYIPLIGIGLIF